MKRNYGRSKPLVIIQCYEDRQQTLPLRREEHAATETATNNHPQLKREATDNPPPPPPMPVNGHQNGAIKPADTLKPMLKPTPMDVKTPNIKKNGTLMRTPTPDYNNKIETRVQSQVKNGKDEKAELESLESYKLKNPLNVQPKPPSNYFMKAPNGTATMKKLARPVSVTIGEYAYGGGSRKEPTKLDFLNGDKPDGPQKGVDDVSLSNRLQSELVLTLSRSNLRKKTEALDKRMFARNQIKETHINEDSDSSLDKSFHARYGNNMLPLAPSISIPKISKFKNSSNLTRLEI